MLSAPSSRASTFAGTLAYRMRQAVQGAGKSLARDFGDVVQLEARQASRTYFVARAREKASQLLRRTLQKDFPDWHYYEEDSAALETLENPTEAAASAAAHSSQSVKSVRKPDAFFLAAPLSGWRNFMAGLPFFAVGLTAMATPDDPVVFMVYDPVRHELFWAQKREAAWCDGQLLRQRLRLRSFEGWRGATLGLSPGAAARHPHLFAQSDQEETFNLYLSESVPLLTAWLGANRLDGLFLDAAPPTESSTENPTESPGSSGQLGGQTRHRLGYRLGPRIGSRGGGRIGWPGAILFLQLAGAHLTDLRGESIGLGPGSACELVGASRALHPALLAHLTRRPPVWPSLAPAPGGDEHRHEPEADKLQSPVFSRLAHRASLFASEETKEPEETKD